MIITTPLENERFYHIYNRGNNGEILFREAENYHYFLRLMAKHILLAVDVYSYCLLNNHFHLLVKIKVINAEQNFSNFFNAYAKAYNKKYNRTESYLKTGLNEKRLQMTSI